MVYAAVNYYSRGVLYLKEKNKVTIVFALRFHKYWFFLNLLTDCAVCIMVVKRHRSTAIRSADIFCSKEMANRLVAKNRSELYIYFCDEKHIYSPLLHQ